MGLVTVGARLGGIMAPFIVMLGDTHPNLQVCTCTCTSTCTYTSTCTCTCTSTCTCTCTTTCTCTFTCTCTCNLPQFTVFGLLSLAAGLANTRLPETLGRPLPDTLADMARLLGGPEGRGQGGQVQGARGEQGGQVQEKEMLLMEEGE